jgi:hypothetical protein
LCDKLKRGRKHVTVIVGTELFAGNAKGRAGDSRRKEVYSRKVLSPEVADVLLDNVPMRPILAECGAKLGLVFDGSSVVKTGSLKAEGLAATARTKFENRKAHPPPVVLNSDTSASEYELVAKLF